MPKGIYIVLRHLKNIDVTNTARTFENIVLTRAETDRKHSLYICSSASMPCSVLWSAECQMPVRDPGRLENDA